MSRSRSDSALAPRSSPCLATQHDHLATEASRRRRGCSYGLRPRTSPDNAASRSTRRTRRTGVAGLSLFLDLLTEVTLPIVALMALGWLVQPRLKLDLATLTRIQIHVILPCFLIHFLSTAELPLSAVWTSAWFTVVSFVALAALGWLAATVLGVGRDLRPVLALAAAFPNSGNFGIPVVQLAFPPDYLLHQAVIVSLHSVLIAVAGVWLLSESRESPAGALRTLARSPMILAVVAGLVLKGFEVRLPTLVSEPLRLMGTAYGPLALFTLGVQLAGARAAVAPLPLSLAVAMRLVLAPALVWGALVLLGVPDDVTNLLVVASCAPVGVLLAIFCVDYRRHPETASAAVVVSTVLSPLTVTCWLLAVRLV